MTLGDYPPLKKAVREILKDRLMSEFLSGVFDQKTEELVEAVTNITLTPGDIFTLSFDYVIQHNDLIELLKSRGR